MKLHPDDIKAIAKEVYVLIDRAQRNASYELSERLKAFTPTHHTPEEKECLEGAKKKAKAHYKHTSNTSTGVCGVIWCKQRNKFKVQFRNKHLGYFETVAEGEVIRRAAEKEFDDAHV